MHTCARHRPSGSPHRAPLAILLTTNILLLSVYAQNSPRTTRNGDSSTVQTTSSSLRGAFISLPRSRFFSTVPHPYGTHLRSRSNDNGSFDQTDGFYYIFAGLFLIFMAVCLWLGHVRRRRRRLMQVRAAGQNALALDIDNLPYPNNRRWAGPPGTTLNVRRDEGLDERGEAPPPYKPDGQEAQEPGQTANVAIPLQTFGPNSNLPKPPEYQYDQSYYGQTSDEQGSSAPVAYGRPS